MAAGETAMPLYEYQCTDCRRSFEILQSLGAGPGGLECPGCGGADLVKQFSTFAPSTSSGNGGRSAVRAADAAPACGTGFT